MERQSFFQEGEIASFLRENSIFIYLWQTFHLCGVGEIYLIFPNSDLKEIESKNETLISLIMIFHFTQDIRRCPDSDTYTQKLHGRSTYIRIPLPPGMSEVFIRSPENSQIASGFTVNKYKRARCRDENRTGVCQRGAACCFRHAKDVVRRETCRYWIFFLCTKNGTCPKEHFFPDSEV